MLFDFDGTLVDSTYLHAVTWWQAMRAAGHDATVSTIHRAIGAASDEVVRQALGEGHEDEVGEIATAQKALYSAWWPHLRPTSAATQLLQRCHDDGLTVVLASSAPAREMTVLRRVLDSDNLIDVITTADDAEHSKPQPDIVQAALNQADLDASHAVLIGDAIWDVEAAARAGVPCIGLGCGGTSQAELTDAGAVHTFADPADLLEHFEAVHATVRGNS